MQKLFNRILQKNPWKVAHGPRKKPSDFDGNRDHVTLGLRLSLVLGLGYGTS